MSHHPPTLPLTPPLTPPTPSSTPPVPNSISALLDHHWHLLSLDAQPPPLPSQFLTVIESQLHEAVRDAEIIEAARQRACERAAALSVALDAARRDGAVLQAVVARLQADNSALRGCIIALQAAHRADAAISDLVIRDQAEEISELRERIRASFHVTPEVLPEKEAFPGSDDSLEDEDNKLLLSTCSSPPHHAFREVAKNMTIRAMERRESIKSLQHVKQSLFESFRRRHSISIQAVVRRSSQIFLSSHVDLSKLSISQTAKNAPNAQT